FEEQIELHNYGSREAIVPLEIRVGGDFSHIFAVKRRMLGERSGAAADSGTFTQRGPKEYCMEAPDDRQGVRVLLRFDRLAREADMHSGRLRFQLTVPPEGSAELHLECDARGPAAQAVSPRGPAPTLESPPTVRARGDLGGALVRAYDRAMRDLYALAIRGRTIGLTEGDESVAYAAGIPWYIALFGRDALITSHMTLPYAPAFAAGSLRALSRL
ncbi:amylo-alpha-1,6-glucosidase, partial [mine drainage metagenome]